MSKKHLCVVLHEGEGGRRFAEELLRRFKQTYGSDVPVVIDLHSFVQDKYDSLIDHLQSTKYCLVAINAEFLADDWQQYCSKQAQRYSMQGELTIVPVGIDNFDTFTGFWSIYSPVVFGHDVSTEDYKFGIIISAIQPDAGTEHISEPQPAVQENQPSDTIEVQDRWRALLASCASFIIEGVDPINFVNDLYSQSAITTTQAESAHSGTARRAKTQTLLDAVMENGTRSIQLFIKSLSRHHGHVYTRILEEYIRPNSLSFDDTLARTFAAKEDSEEWRTLLQTYFSLLVDAVDPVHVLDLAYSRSAISQNQYDEVRTVSTRQDQMVKLLHYVMGNGPHAIQSFIRTLQRNERSVYSTIVDQYMTPNGMSLDLSPSSSRPNAPPAAPHMAAPPTQPVAAPASPTKQPPSSSSQSHQSNNFPVQETESPSFVQFRDDQKLDLFQTSK